MHPVLEHLPPAGGESFFAKAFEYSYFPTPWHYHPEFELVLVTESRGKRFIGNYMDDFADGNLTFLGPNLPHLYRNAPEYYQPGSSLRARSVVVHFLPTSIGNDFLALPQAASLRLLFELASQGIDVLGETRRVVARKMEILLQTQGLERLIGLLDILRVLAETDEYRLLASPGITGRPTKDSERLEKVFEHIFLHFRQPVSLAEVAALANLTRTSFCRYFRERTRRNFSDFVVELRLNHAGKLLRETTLSVLEISLECGYPNLSNFNRQFRRQFNQSPIEYRKKFL